MPLYRCGIALQSTGAIAENSLRKLLLANCVVYSNRMPDYSSLKLANMHLVYMDAGCNNDSNNWCRNGA